MSKLVVIGSSNTDMIIQVPRLPGPGETILGGTFTTAAGGKGANQAVAAARAGSNVTFVAAVGDDMFGKQALEGFEKEGIYIGMCVIDANAPSSRPRANGDRKRRPFAAAHGAPIMARRARRCSSPRAIPMTMRRRSRIALRARPRG